MVSVWRVCAYITGGLFVWLFFVFVFKLFLPELPANISLAWFTLTGAAGDVFYSSERKHRG